MDMMCMEFSENILQNPVDGPLNNMVESGVSAKCHYLQKDDLEESLMYQLTGEEPTMPVKDYMHRIQEDANAPNWRKRIVEWMIEVSSEFDMSMDTVACAVNYMDRYLSEFKADKVLLQLLAMVCLSLASKMFETAPITMDEMRMLSRGAFQKCDIRDVEKQVLLTTRWHLNPVTSVSVARHVTALEPQADVRQWLETQISPMLQMALRDHVFLAFKPSTVALAAVLAAHVKLGRAVSSPLRTLLSSFAWATDNVRLCQRAFVDATTPHLVPLSASAQPFIDTTNLLAHQKTPTNLVNPRSDSPTAIEDFVQVLADENQPPQYLMKGQVAPAKPNSQQYFGASHVHHHTLHRPHHHAGLKSKKRSRLEI